MRTTPTAQLSVFEASETLRDFAVIPCPRLSSDIPRVRSELRHRAPNSGKFVYESRGASLNEAIIRPDVQKAVTDSFRTGQALPLVFTRFLCPHARRGEYADGPRDIPRRWQQTRQIREHEQSTIMTRPRLFRVREQSVSTVYPKPQPRSLPGHVHKCIRFSKIRRKAVAAHTACPQTVHDLERFMSATSPRRSITQERKLAKDSHRLRLIGSMSRPERFQIRIRIVPFYALV